MSRRHDKLGVKQTIQRTWMDKTVRMMLAGLSEKQIRTELDEYLATQRQSGGVGERGKRTYGMAISLLASWFSPDKELVSFRDDALQLAEKVSPDEWMPLHWAVVSASYPFWYNVALQTGRLFNLQEQVMQRQIFSRLKEQYGDREVVARNARYTVRSFVAWGVMRDSDRKGCYLKAKPVAIRRTDMAVLLLESMLLATPSAKGLLASLFNNPACFPFSTPAMSGIEVSELNARIEAVRYSLDDEMLHLKHTA